MTDLLKAFNFDYRLGYVRANCALPGFDVLNGSSPSAKRIVALGGYTTPNHVAEKTSWVNCLHAQLESEAQIYNGDTDGYSSAQELIMFIRDGILLHPHTVVCLSGFNNFAYHLGFVPSRDKAEILKRHPFATPNQIDFFHNITSRLGLGREKVYYGIESNVSAWELWLTHMEILNAVCADFGINFMAFLQPCIFSGKYRRSQRENMFLEQTFSLTQETVEEFSCMFKEQYKNATIRIKDLDYITDISSLFDSENDIYLDAYHVEDAYARKLGLAIYSSLNTL